jgi:hypothetical protein
MKASCCALLATTGAICATKFAAPGGPEREAGGGAAVILQ